MQCRVHGNPKPKITWRKSCKYQYIFAKNLSVIKLALNIRSSHRFRLLDDNQILRIDQVQSGDEGVYTCTAENSLRRISASTDVRVRDPSWYCSSSLIFLVISY